MMMPATDEGSVFDPARARRDTPGCEEVLHFNDDGASLMPEPVEEYVLSDGVLAPATRPRPCHATSAPADGRVLQSKVLVHAG